MDQLKWIHFLGEYAKNKNWDVSQLTVEQEKEIRTEFLKTLNIIVSKEAKQTGSI